MAWLRWYGWHGVYRQSVERSPLADLYYVCKRKTEFRVRVQLTQSSSIRNLPRGVISTFSWGANFFYIFQCHRTIEKLENSTLYVVI